MASLLDSAAIISVGSGLPLWGSAFDLGTWNLGAIGAVMTFGIAFGAVFGGVLADRLGRTILFSAALVGYCAGATVIATATTFGQLLAGVVVLGVCSGADLPASIAIVADGAPAHGVGRMVAGTHVMWGIGVVLATAAAFAVSPLGLLGVRGIFLALAVGAIVTLVARRRTPTPILRGGESRSIGQPAVVVPDRKDRRAVLAAIAAFYVLYTLVANTFGSFRTLLLVSVGGTSQTGATAIAFAVTVVGVIGGFAFVALVDTPWRRRLYPVAAVLLVGSQITLAVTGAATAGAIFVALTAYALAFPFAGEALYKVWAQEHAAAHLRASFQGGSIALARTVAGCFALVTPAVMAASPTLLFSLLAAFAGSAALMGLFILSRSD